MRKFKARWWVDSPLAEHKDSTYSFYLWGERNALKCHPLMHAWQHLSRLGNPVIGVSTCRECKVKARSFDVKLANSKRRLQEFSVRAA